MPEVYLLHCYLGSRRYLQNFLTCGEAQAAAIFWLRGVYCYDRVDWQYFDGVVGWLGFRSGYLSYKPFATITALDLSEPTSC